MPALTGLPTPPSDATKGVASWMTAVRNRLLQLKVNQFSDEQARRLLALLGSSGQTTEVTVTAAGPVALAEPWTFFDGTGNAEFKTVSVVDAGIPADATAVMIEARWWLLGNVGTEERWASARPAGSIMGNGSTDNAILLAFGIKSGGSGGQAGGNSQAIVPLVGGQFEYSSLRSGYGWSRLRLRITGYFPGSAA